MGVPFQRGDQIALVSWSSIASRLNLYANVRRESGAVDSYSLGRGHTPNTDRTNATTLGGPLGAPGEIEGLIIRPADSGVTFPKRGQCFLLVQLFRAGNVIQNLATGYWDEVHSPSLNEFVEAGPAGGEGHLVWNQAGNDEAGNVATTINLGVANALRCYKQLFILYHSSADVATRVIGVLLRDLAVAGGPTGFSIARDFWLEDTINLTQNEEGIWWMKEGGSGIITYNDNGTRTQADHTTDSSIFPFWAMEDETGDIIVTVTDGNAADDYDVWIQYEEWIKP